MADSKHRHLHARHCNYIVDMLTDDEIPASAAKSVLREHLSQRVAKLVYDDLSAILRRIREEKS